MRGKIPTKELCFDPEIEKTARKNRRKAKKQKEFLAKHQQQQDLSSASHSLSPSAEELMADQNQRPIGANSPRHLTRAPRPQGNARPTEMKTGLLQLLAANPFAGLDHEDPYAHLIKFYELCGTVGSTEAEEETTFLRLFSFSLIGKAKEWLLDQPAQTMTDWNLVEEKFLDRYFPQSKFMDAKTAISVFSQQVSETLCEAWERYKSLLRKCPNHGFDDQTQIHIFRKGLQQQPKLLLDATAGGSLMSKPSGEAIAIIEAMAKSDHQSQHDRSLPPRRGVLELGTQDALLAQNKLFTQQMEQLTKQMSKLPQQIKELNEPSTQQVFRCELCDGEHLTGRCPPATGEEVNFVSNQPRQGQFQGNNYPRNNNPGFGQGWRQDQGPSNRPPYQQNQQPTPFQQLTERATRLEDTLAQFMQASLTNQKNSEASMKNLEVQVGQLAKQLSEYHAGTFSGNTQPNPKEHGSSSGKSS